MRRIVSLILLLFLSWSLFDDVIYAQRNHSSSAAAKEQESQKKVIDLTADIVYPKTLNDSVEVVCLVGNFAAQHNGAIITADSAVRYNDKRLECFGNVLINKNTLYAYADRADYNGELNEVSLYAPIIKVVDGDAVLYCYNFTFNTLDNIGTYVGGGVMFNDDNVMESVVGYYYSDQKELIGVGDVQYSGNEYQLTGDSVIYNTETEGARYFNNTNIWNQKDEYLYADAGDYDKTADRYSFSLGGYILTEEQEMWSDSMDYYRAVEHIYMRHNIQIDDTVQKSLIFGDYGEYIKTPGDMILVGNPQIINYDLEQGDSLFMRADTFEIFTLNRFASDTTIVSATQMAESSLQELVQAPQKDAHQGHNHDHDHGDHDHDHAEQSNQTLTSPPNAQRGGDTPPPPRGDRPTRPSSPAESISAESSITPPTSGASSPRVNVGSDAARREELAASAQANKLPEDDEQDESQIDSILHDSLNMPQLDSLALDSLALDSLALDSLALDSLRLDSLAQAADTLKFWQRKKAAYLEAQKERRAVKAREDAARKVVLDSIGRARQIKINEKLDAEKVREARQVAARKARIAERDAQKVRRAVERGKISASDTLAIMEALVADTAATFEASNWREKFAEAAVDSLALDSLALDSLALDSMALDSLALDSLALEPVKVDSLYRLTKGYRNVKIYRSDFQAIADSMVTNSIDSIIRLYISPVLWHDTSQVTSEVMDIYTSNNSIDKAIFTGGTPIMGSELQKDIYYNQVAGKVITTLFEDGSAYRTDVDGNAQTIYFMQDDETQEVNGMMDMLSGGATFYIEEQAVVGITYRSEPTYTIFPMDMIPADQPMSLKGFEWHQDKRPEQEQVFTRIVRPSQRESKSAIPRPEFPIQDELDRHRKDLIESRQWIDRTEVVSPHAEAWMNSLGFTTGQPREQK